MGLKNTTTDVTFYVKKKFFARPDSAPPTRTRTFVTVINYAPKSPRLPALLRPPSSIIRSIQLETHKGALFTNLHYTNYK